MDDKDVWRFIDPADAGSNAGRIYRNGNNK